MAFHYLLTFSTYGSHLPGEPETVDLEHRIYRTPFPEPDALRELNSNLRMREPPFILSTLELRNATLQAIQSTCKRRGWDLIAVHVRTNHVHVVVKADRRPELVLTALKSNATLALSELDGTPTRTRRWTRHGSTRYLWKESHLLGAIEYVTRRQGEPMAVFEAPLVTTRGSVELA